MSEEPSDPRAPTEPELLAEGEHDERAERRIFIRQVTIVLLLVALLLAHLVFR